MLQLVCCEACLCVYFDKQKKKSRSLARKYAFQLGYKSMSEVRFACKLLEKGIKFKYEPDAFTYQLPPRTYTPDYKITIGDKVLYLEYKGKLDTNTRKMLVTFKSQYPKVDLRLVFEKPKNRIYKGAKMRYCDWADKYYYKWYDIKDIQPLFKELI